MAYCTSRFETIRRRTVEVKVGSVAIGAHHPIRVQSMTTSNTQDVDATVRQSIALAEVGCEIIRVTAPNVAAAKCLRDIRAQLSAHGFPNIPLVADIHFLPSAAMEAVEHVEKIRVNPGNYADKKKFAVKEYTDADYVEELERIHETFSPLVLRCKELGRAMRIGTNHGSLSDRIMNRYGDTPLGMVESALEFLRICRGHNYHDIVLSMKASNPKVMIQAYRLLVERMQMEDMHYPLHLGVTEAGDGEDGRIKSAIGIGSLLNDGLGDTIRVSLTEDSVYEVPVAQALARKAMARWQSASAISHQPSPPPEAAPDAIDPFHFTRRGVTSLPLGPDCLVGPEQPPRVIVRAPSVAALGDTLQKLAAVRLTDTPLEGIVTPVATATEATAALATATQAKLRPQFLILELAATLTPADLIPVAQAAGADTPALVLLRAFAGEEADTLAGFAKLVRTHGHTLAIATTDDDVALLTPILRQLGDEHLLFTHSGVASAQHPRTHPVGAYRALADALRHTGCRAPLWIRNIAAGNDPATDFLSRLLDASILTGSLLCDGLGDLVSLETDPAPDRALKLAYNVLQGTGARITRTEFVACPSCGRTLFDLQTTTQRIRSRTGHLKGVKIAIMGCIVNGPGEMADADFGYVGGAPGKINLYVGKTCVQYNIPQDQADDRLVALIRDHGKWTDPESVATV
ncbi:MAG: (E)-4-hydroxy-3-methylbut-2-enyl-diphosphate synthase [Verrucomicrobiota bacterium]